MFNSYFDVMHFTCLNVLSASCLSTLEGHEAVYIRKWCSNAKCQEDRQTMSFTFQSFLQNPGCQVRCGQKRAKVPFYPVSFARHLPVHCLLSVILINPMPCSNVAFPSRLSAVRLHLPPRHTVKCSFFVSTCKTQYTSVSPLFTRANSVLFAFQRLQLIIRGLRRQGKKS